jgi:hypothetical protein
VPETGGHVIDTTTDVPTCPYCAPCDISLGAPLTDEEPLIGALGVQALAYAYALREARAEVLAARADALTWWGERGVERRHADNLTWALRGRRRALDERQSEIESLTSRLLEDDEIIARLRGIIAALYRELDRAYVRPELTEVMRQARTIAEDEEGT